MCVRLDGALDLEYDVTNRYTGKYFEEEIKGLADASGCSEKLIRRIHMIGELTLVKQKMKSHKVRIVFLKSSKGQCSMFGANATATPEGHLLQLRALDWDVDGKKKTHFIKASYYKKFTCRAIQELPSNYCVSSKLRQWPCLC